MDAATELSKPVRPLPIDFNEVYRVAAEHRLTILHPENRGDSWFVLDEGGTQRFRTTEFSEVAEFVAHYEG